MPSALLWASLAEILFWILQIRRGCGPAGFAFSRERALREVVSAVVGLRPKRSKSNAFYGNAPHRGAGAQRLRGVPIGGSRKYGEKIFTPNGVNLPYFRVEPTSLGSERGEQPLSRCGERGVQRERGGESKHPTHPLAQRRDPGGDAACKSHRA